MTEESLQGDPVRLHALNTNPNLHRGKDKCRSYDQNYSVYKGQNISFTIRYMSNKLTIDVKGAHLWLGCMGVNATGIVLLPYQPPAE